MKTSLSLITCLLLGVSLGAQTLTSRILDAETGQPVPFATVLSGRDFGTISNEEGFFSLDLSRIPEEGVRISCMGYDTYTADLETLREQDTLRLKPAPIHLNEVRVGERIPEASEIIRKVRENITANYPAGGQDYTFFYRESEYMNFEELDLEVEKDSELDRGQLEKAQEELSALGRYITDSRPVTFLDMNGIHSRQKDTSLLWVERATELVDAKNDFSMEKLQERAQKIVLSHLDTTQTYKIKTGILTVEDSLSMKDEMSKNDSEDSVEVKYLNGRVTDLLAVGGFRDGERLAGFIDPDQYRYELVTPTYFNGFYVYAVRFSPRKRKAKFEGTLYIDASSYAVLKADYAYARGRQGESVNLKLLLGVKYVENQDSGTVVFQRDESGTYHPYYIQKEYGNYVYLHRNLKFIENSDSKRKVRFDFLLEGGVRQKESMLLKPLAVPGFEASKDRVFVQKLESYQPTIWQDTEIIAPLEEMKNFKVGN